MQYLTIWDVVLTPFYLLILAAIAKRHRDKKYPRGHQLRPYYLQGLYLKFAGAIFIAVIYQFYYGGGDTFNYYYHAKIINSSLNDSVSTWINLLLRRPPEVDPKMYQYTSQMYWYTDPSAYPISVIAAILGLLNGTTYIPIALLFAYLSYSGIWAMYKTFARIYPQLHKPLAIAFLFVPSTFVWGSAIFKDTVCMFALGWMTCCTFRLIVDKDFSFRNLFLLVISFYLLATIKIYIVLAFAPALALWVMLTYSHKIKAAAVRWVVNFMFIGISVAGLLFFAKRFATELNEYSLDNISKKAQKTQVWITYVSDVSEGSKYDIGRIDGTLGGMVMKFPQAVNVTLYRPYLWEAKKPIMLLSALEAAAFLVLTLKVFYKKGISQTFKQVGKDPNLMFFLIFTIVFAFAVGVSTGNFGSLSRYKIPCMPFFASLLLILYYQPRAIVSTRKVVTHEAKEPVHRFA